MNRRIFIVVFFLALTKLIVNAFAAPRRLKKFHFRIKTKSGNIVGNVSIEAYDVEAAKVKLRKRYPDCEILNVSVK